MKCGSLAIFRLCHLPKLTLVANGRIKTYRKFHFQIPRGLWKAPSRLHSQLLSRVLLQEEDDAEQTGTASCDSVDAPPQVRSLALSMSAEQMHRTAAASRQLQCKDQDITYTADIRGSSNLGAKG